MVSTELPTATMALGLPRRRARRRYRAPRKVSVRECAEHDPPDSAGQPRVALAAGLAADLPADWWVCGQNLAHDTRCAAVGNRAMSTPISAISSAAATVFTPGMSASWAAGREKGPIASAMRASSAAIWALIRSMLSSIICRIVA